MVKKSIQHEDSKFFQEIGALNKIQTKILEMKNLECQINTQYKPFMVDFIR